jgi:hypothetical protein
MANSEKTPTTFQELLVSCLATTDALAKLLIKKGIITEQEFLQKVSEERAMYQRILKATAVTGIVDGTEIYTEKLSLCRRSHGGRLRQSQFVRIQ